MALPSLISHYLVPEPPDAPAAALPAGFTLLDQPVLEGLPLRIRLLPDLTLTLVLPTGLAQEWVEADGHAPVSRSASEAGPYDASIPAETRAAARLIARGADGARLGVVPLSLGAVQAVAGPDGLRLQVIVLGYELVAGNVRGPGDWGGRIALGWRKADEGAARFAPPPLNPYVLPRLLRRRESDVIGSSLITAQPSLANAREEVDRRLREAKAQWSRRRRLLRRISP